MGHGLLKLHSGALTAMYSTALHSLLASPTLRHHLEPVLCPAWYRPGERNGGPGMRNSAASAKEKREEEEEVFYESLDRILSSSCSSTTASDDDTDHHRCRGRRRPHHLPSFPLSLDSSYGAWTSELSSVEERRRCLLQQLGLTDEPFPAAANQPASFSGARYRGVEVFPPLRSGVQYGRPSPSSPSSVAIIVNSSSSVDSRRVRVEQPQRHAISFGTTTASNNSPFNRQSWGLEGGRNDIFSNDGGCRDQCVIKNLDDRGELVVKEVLEDGMWNGLKGVGTRRQLTMEELEIWVGRSPIVRELWLRQSVKQCGSGGSMMNGSGSEVPDVRSKSGTGNSESLMPKKKGSWLMSIKKMAGTVVNGRRHRHRERWSNDEKESSSEKGRRSSSSATDDSLDGSHPLHVPKRMKVRQHGKSFKELTGLYITQEIAAHNGAIWSMKFSLDARYLASGGEDCVIHVWEMAELDGKGELTKRGMVENGNCNPFLSVAGNRLQEPAVEMSCGEDAYWTKKRRAKTLNGRKSLSSEHSMLPEHIFALSGKPICSFTGHTADVLDLSWSKSQHLISSSMDKTVRLWHMSSSSCLKIFAHTDYVTGIQFNPVDDRYFISGSLDEKVRIWGIPDRQIVDWKDLREMVTAVCFAPNGLSAIVGTHRGSCHQFDTSENKLYVKSQIYFQAKNRRSSRKKITGFQFFPGSSSEVLITSADSRIHVVSGMDLIHKFKGFRNTSSQIAASLASNGKYLISASEDSNVYMWRYDADAHPSRAKGAVNSTESYEHFHCKDVTVAVAWPNSSSGVPGLAGHNCRQNGLDLVSDVELDSQTCGHETSSIHGCIELDSAAWLQDELTRNALTYPNCGELFHRVQRPGKSAWGMVFVTAGRGGEIRIYQNFGIPCRV